MGFLYSKEEDKKTFDKLIENLGIDLDSIEDNENKKDNKQEKQK